METKKDKTLENAEKIAKVFGLDKKEPNTKILDEFCTETIIEYLYNSVCFGHEFPSGFTTFHPPIIDKKDAKEVQRKLIWIMENLCPDRTVNVKDKIIILQNISMNKCIELEEIANNLE